MADQSLPPIKTHPISVPNGRLYVVVDRGDGEPTLETSAGTRVGYCDVTGPEILKLAEGGRALWNALDGVLTAAAGLLMASPVAAAKRKDDLREISASALSVLNATAPLFDHNEPEERPRGGWEEPEPERHNPERPIPLVPEVDRAD
jgi:hypothetical protein